MNWMKSNLRWILTVAFLSPFGTVLQKNVEKLAEQYGWDNAFVKAVAAMPDLTALLQNIWFCSFIGILGGIVAYLWTDFFSRRKVEFFATREELETAHPLSKIFEPGNKISGAFLRGDGIFRGLSARYKQIDRLVFPPANAPSVLAMASSSMPNAWTYKEYPKEIALATSEAKSHGVKDLRTTFDFFGMTILMCNPDDNNGWMHISLAHPYLEHEHRPTIRIEKSKHKKAFDQFKAAFDAMFNDGAKVP